MCALFQSESGDITLQNVPNWYTCTMYNGSRRVARTYARTMVLEYVHVYHVVRPYKYNIIFKTTTNSSTQTQRGNSWALSASKTSRYATVPTRQRGLQRGSPPQSSQASMWACTRTSACIASLRTVSVVVRVCGFHGWSSWLGTCSPGSGAIRVSSQSRSALLTRPPVSRMNGMKDHGTNGIRVRTLGTVQTTLSQNVQPQPWY
jgi:hypothetical protein